jgi:O-antigen/teichoic acid export membrane protein
MARAVVFIGGTATTPLIWHGSGYDGALIMVSWQLAGDASALLIQLLANPGRDIALAFRPRIRKAFSALLFYRKTLGALALAQIIGSINQQLPITTVMFAFGANSAGWYSLASNLVYMPCKIISSAVGDVYNQRLARLHADGEPVFNLTTRATIWMAVIGLGPFTLIALLAADLLALVSGPEWQGAAYSAAILALGSYMFFISIPASNMALIVHARRYIVCWHVLRMATLVTFGGIAMLGLVSYETWLIFFVSGEIFVYAIEILFGMYFARNADPREVGGEVRA